MPSDDWTYGDATEVCERVMSTNQDEVDVVAVLANAMRRIADLEWRLAKAESAAAPRQQRSRANGAKPD